MILLISDSALRARAIASYLHTDGQHSLLASLETALFLCDKKDIGGIVIDLTDSNALAQEMLRTLLARYPQMPVALILPDGTSPSELCETIRDSDPSSIAARVNCFYASQCGFSAASLSAATLTVELTSKSACYKGYPLSLTPTELRILHLLLYRAPRPTSAEDILTLCFPNTPHKLATLAVHIHHINQKAALIDPRPLVSHSPSGYRLRAGVL